MTDGSNAVDEVARVEFGTAVENNAETVAADAPEALSAGKSEVLSAGESEAEAEDEGAPELEAPVAPAPFAFVLGAGQPPVPELPTRRSRRLASQQGQPRVGQSARTLGGAARTPVQASAERFFGALSASKPVDTAVEPDPDEVLPEPVAEPDSEALETPVAESAGAEPAGSDPIANTEPDTESGSEPAANPTLSLPSGTEPESEPEPDLASESEPEPDLASESEPDLAPEPEPDLAPEPEPDLAPEPEPDLAPQLVSEPAPAVAADPPAEPPSDSATSGPTPRRRVRASARFWVALGLGIAVLAAVIAVFLIRAGGAEALAAPFTTLTDTEDGYTLAWEGPAVSYSVLITDASGVYASEYAVGMTDTRELTIPRDEVGAAPCFIVVPAELQPDLDPTADGETLARQGASRICPDAFSAA
ncbi:hypothetical protein [Mycetocola tolaasinivorans]|uniref:hypothetical protein n=1 Tax=Mycetocola tolaasinivorans TaxID=76635 RepID=UPI001602EA04|nr:hypothetical protein [Mycetocola tolaasinivorans]